MAPRKKLVIESGSFDLAQLNPAWADFSIGADGLFYNPQWRRGFAPGELKAQFWQLQELSHTRHRLDQLRKELQRAEDHIQSAEARAYFYRSQLTLESRAGLMLQALTHEAT